MNKIEIKISACIENESVVRNAIACFASSLNPTIDEIIDIKTILSEAVSNAIIHGYNYDKNKDVYVKASLDKNNLEIIVQDFGVGISDIEEALKTNYSSLKDQEKTGIGFTIIKSLSDSFKIQSAKNVGTKLIISKVLSKNAIKAK